MIFCHFPKRMKILNYIWITSICAMKKISLLRKINKQQITFSWYWNAALQERNQFITSVYRKPKFSGVYSQFYSFIHVRYSIYYWIDFFPSILFFRYVPLHNGIIKLTWIFGKNEKDWKVSPSIFKQNLF